MIILSIRTDKPESELGLFNGSEQLGYVSWQAHRELSTTIHKKIQELLENHQKDWRDLSGIVCFKGPGSFTGLRIGLTVANTLASSLNISIIGSLGDEWIEAGIKQIELGKNEKIVLPEYGQEPHITKQKT